MAKSQDGEEPVTILKTRFKLVDKRAALVDIGKHIGMFVDRKDISVSVNPWKEILELTSRDADGNTIRDDTVH